MISTKTTLLILGSALIGSLLTRAETSSPPVAQTSPGLTKIERPALAASPEGWVDASRSVRVAAFLQSMDRFGDPVSATRWKDLAVDPTASGWLDGALRFERFPSEGFATREPFLAWWQDGALPLWNRVRERIEPD